MKEERNLRISLGLPNHVSIQHMNSLEGAGIARVVLLSILPVRRVSTEYVESERRDKPSQPPVGAVTDRIIIRNLTAAIE